MRKEGWDIPSLPVAWIEAENYSDAKRRLLNVVSQYGEVTKQGFHDFFADTDFKWESVISDIRVPELNLGSFALEFGDNPESEEQKTKEKKKLTKCPGCSLEF